MTIAGTAADIQLPMERPLYTPAVKARLDDCVVAAGVAEVNTSALFSQFVIDRGRLARNIDQALQQRSQITLSELCEAQPVQQGLAEVLTYLQLADDDYATTVDENVSDTVRWTAIDGGGVECLREARLPRIIFVRNG